MAPEMRYRVPEQDLDVDPSEIPTLPASGRLPTANVRRALPALGAHSLAGKP